MREDIDSSPVAVSVVEPKPDRWNLVFIIMMIHGMGTLLPWNMFITAKAYFEDQKLNVSHQDSEINEYRDYFINYLGITAQVPVVAFSFVNMCWQRAGNKGSRTTSVRIVSSLVVILVVFVLTVILAIVDSSQWPGVFFWVTMVSVVIINSAIGVYANSLYGVAATLPMKYTNAAILGTNFSGTLTALISIVSIAAAPDLRLAAIYYFVTAVFMLIVCIGSYFLLLRLAFFKHHQQIAHAPILRSGDHYRKRPPFLKIFKKIKTQLISVWFVFCVSLTLFPAFQSNIRRVDPNFFVELYWVPVFCFLSFNLFAFIGNIVSQWIKVPQPKFIWIPVLLRGLVFIPFFILCNYRPEIRDFSKLAVIIANDYGYIVGSVLMALTSGYFSSLCMMYGPKIVKPELASTAGTMMAFSIGFGLLSGTLFSLALTKMMAVFAGISSAT